MSQPQTTTEVTNSSEPIKSCSQAVVEAVAAAESVEQSDLEPLYSVCDPDALNSLFRTNQQSGLSATGEIQFQYHGYTICVHADGRVRLLDQ